MKIVFLTALGVGGATVFGSLIGFLVKKIPKRFSDLTIGFAGGVMLAAAIWGLIIPSMAEGGGLKTLVTVVGMTLGAFFIGTCERLVPKLRFVVGVDERSEEVDSVLLLILAMAIHNMPEGIAAGISVGSGDVAGAAAVAGGIALQNIPEGMAIIPPMLAVGMSRKRAFLLALLTGITEVVGTFLGYSAITCFSGILPIALAFAGGAMIYVIVAEMIPLVNLHGKTGVYVFMSGIAAMLLADVIL